MYTDGERAMAGVMMENYVVHVILPDDAYTSLWFHFSHFKLDIELERRLNCD